MTERELIERCIAKDNEAWKEFICRYDTTINTAIHNISDKFSCRNATFIEDIRSEIFEKLLADNCLALRSFMWQCDFATWLYKLTKNKTYDYFRKALRRRTVPIDECVGNMIPRRVRHGKELTAKLTVEELLNNLTEENRDIMIMHYIYGFKYKDMVETMGLSEDALHHRAMRACKTLRKKI